jgi:hypothetical protein
VPSERSKNAEVMELNGIHQLSVYADVLGGSINIVINTHRSCIRFLA